MNIVDTGQMVMTTSTMYQTQNPMRTTVIRRSVLGNIAFDIIRNGDAAELMKFLKSNGDIQCKDSNGVNVLMMACGKGDFAKVKIIIDSGKISATERDDKGRNCLHHLCLGRKQSKEIFHYISPRLLIGMKDFENKTPLQVAVQLHLDLLTKMMLELEDYQDVSICYFYGTPLIQKPRQEVPVNRYGFVLDQNNPEKTATFEVKDLTKQQVKQNTLRIPKWNKMISYYKKGVVHRKLTLRTYKGMPDEVRSAVWKLFLLNNNYQFSDANQSTIYESVKGSDHNLLTEGNDDTTIGKLRDEYVRNNQLGTRAKDDKQLDLDIPRTYQYHWSYQKRYNGNQKVLFNIIHSLMQSGNVTSEIDYIQGITHAPSLLTLFLEEEAAYCGSVQLLGDRYKWKEMYNSRFSLLMKCWSVTKKLLEKRNLKVAQKLTQVGIMQQPLPFFLFEWHYTWFIHSFPFELSLRIFDVILLEGFNALFRVADTIFHFLENEIMAMNPNDDWATFQQNLKQPFSVMKNVPSTNAFMKYMFKHHIPDDMIEELLVSV